MNFSAKEILCILPHRFPFLLIDKVIECVPGESATGIKNVTINEPCFQGHFPTEPIFPGILTIEVIAQTIAVMYGSEYFSAAGPSADAADTAAASHIGYLISSNIKFMKPVIPGDTLAVKVKHKATVQNLMSIDASVEVDGFFVAKGNLGVSKKP